MRQEVILLFDNMSLHINGKYYGDIENLTLDLVRREIEVHTVIREVKCYEEPHTSLNMLDPLFLAPKGENLLVRL